MQIAMCKVFVFFSSGTATTVMGPPETLACLGAVESDHFEALAGRGSIFVDFLLNSD